MAFRFLRRISILPGVRLNISKGGPSLSLGPRGASVTIGQRGIWGNVGIPGSGLSYRKRLDGTKAPSAQVQSNPTYVPNEHDINELYVSMLRGILRDRERGDVDWQKAAVVGATPDEDDIEALDVHLRACGWARFAIRMLNGDRAAWTEALSEELRNENLPFKVDFNFGIDEETDEIEIQVELPGTDVVPTRASRPLKNGGVSYRKLPKTIVRRLYEDVCCALAMRLVHEVYRTIPEANVVRLQGYRKETDSATGHEVMPVFLALATDKDSFRAIDLDHVDPSTAFMHLGGAAKLSRGMLMPIGHIPIPNG